MIDMIHRKTKIVCTLGPATEDDAVLRELILSGMNVARLNFSHGTHETHLNNIRRIEAFRRELNLPIAIMLDTKGPEIRLETFENGKVQLKKGQTFTLVTQSVVGNAERASITYPDLPRDIREGTTILIDDGLVEMTVRSLTAGEIVGQFMVARDVYGEWPTRTDENRMLSNIVVMGMGEPLQNVENVIKAMNIITDGEGIAVSRRRITLSTSGIAPRIVEVAEATGVRLAVSLHAPTDEIRSRIMPINKKYPLAEVMKACRDYQSRDGSRYVTFEYLMLNGINDSIENANQLINLMKKYQINAKFNLIAFNPWPGCGFEPSSNNRIHAFAKVLNHAGYAAPIRTPRGQDILAACGQLKSKKDQL